MRSSQYARYLADRPGTSAHMLVNWKDLIALGMWARRLRLTHSAADTLGAQFLHSVHKPPTHLVAHFEMGSLAAAGNPRDDSTGNWHSRYVVIHGIQFSFLFLVRYKLNRFARLRLNSANCSCFCSFFSFCFYSFSSSSSADWCCSDQVSVASPSGKYCASASDTHITLGFKLQAGYRVSSVA